MSFKFTIYVASKDSHSFKDFQETRPIGIRNQLQKTYSFLSISDKTLSSKYVKIFITSLFESNFPQK